MLAEKIFGYARVSSKEQNLDRQIDERCLFMTKQLPFKDSGFVILWFERETILMLHYSSMYFFRKHLTRQCI